MNLMENTLYRQSRAYGVPASRALTCARLNARVEEEWERLASRGMLRVLKVSDDIGWNEGSDWEGFRKEPGANLRAIAKWEKEEERLVGIEGVWGIVAQWRLHPSNAWEDGGSCWGFIGADGPVCDYLTVDELPHGERYSESLSLTETLRAGDNWGIADQCGEALEALQAARAEKETELKADRSAALSERKLREAVERVLTDCTPVPDTESAYVPTLCLGSLQRAARDVYGEAPNLGGSAYRCRSCGRLEEVCSREPCEAVREDREECAPPQQGDSCPVCPGVLYGVRPVCDLCGDAPSGTA